MDMDHHDHHNEVLDMDEGMDKMMMTMYFYQSEKVKFLFKEFDVDSNAGYFGACITAFFFGFVTETLSIMQDRLD